MAKNMIPVYEALIDTNDEGIFCISLVDRPAVESDFVYMEKDKTFQSFKVTDDMEHIVTGVLMRANFPIYRYSDKVGEYYIKYSADTIKIMAEKMLFDGTQNTINLMHKAGTYVDGVNLLETFIKDSTKGISPVGFEDIEEGSLFCTYKINNDEIWDSILNGDFKGFSLEGMFTIEPEKKQKYTKIDMNQIIEKYLTKLIKFSEIETDKGVIEWVGDEDLKVGDEVFQTVDGEKVKVEDGEYKAGKATITIAEGVVTYIDNPVEDEQEVETEEKEEEEQEEMQEEIKEEMEEEEQTEEQPEEQPVEDDKYTALQADVEMLKSKVEELTSLVNDLLAKPAGKPIEEEYNKIEKRKFEKIRPTLVG